MDIRQLRYFIEICKLGSISRTAESLFISQQGLSSSIRRLEDELNCDLFYRKGNTLILTEHGKYLLENATEIVNNFDKLQNHYRNLSQGHNDKISLLCIYSIISKSPKPLQTLLFGGSSDMELSIGECYTSEVPGYMDNNDCHFAICYEQDWASNYDAHYLFRVEHCFIVHKDHPLAVSDSISIQDLNGMNMIIPQRKTAIRTLLDSLIKTYNLHPKIVFETNQALEISNMLANDHSLIGRLTISDAVALNNPSLRILTVRDVDFCTHAVLLHRRDMPMTPTEQRFQQMVLDAVK